MTRNWPTWETLNAYIDGELSAREAAAVARALVTRQELAEQVAQLSRLKLAVQESIPAEVPSLPEIRPQIPWPTLAAGSALLFAIMTGVLLWIEGGVP